MTRFLVPLVAAAVLYYVWRSPDGWAGLWRMLRPFALLGLALLYLRMPFDLIPDALPVGLLDDIAMLLAALYFGGRTMSGESAEQGAGSAHPEGPAVGFDPYEILGVRRGASKEEITRAFRERMKQYHPDRVADLGKELRDVAHEKSVQIQRAYEMLKSR